MTEKENRLNSKPQTKDSRLFIFASRFYIAAALLGAAILSPTVFSFIPVVLLLWYLYQNWRKIPAFAGLLTNVFIFFAICLLYSSIIGPYFSVLAALPGILTIDLSLRDMSWTVKPAGTIKQRSLTGVSVILISIVVIILAIGAAFSNVTLLVSAGILAVYFTSLIVLVLTRIPGRPIEAEQVLQIRVVAGREERAEAFALKKTKLSGNLFLTSPYEWFKISPAFIKLAADRFILKLAITPTLSGPASIIVKGQVIDQWGLIQTQFDFEPVKPIVIPRAKYAEWLANKYLSGMKPGQLPLAANTGAPKTTAGLRRGLEFYGNRMYQPGDSLKSIDWKHTVKYNKLVVKEFIEIQAQPAIILMNAVTGDAEEADKIAYNVLAAAINLAQDGIPAAIAVYNDCGVSMTTQSLSGQSLVQYALEAVKSITQKPADLKYLRPPDVDRLRANINRLRQTESQSGTALRELLQIEYKNLGYWAKMNPCTEALSVVTARSNQQSAVIVISSNNHDTEALAFNIHNLKSKGIATVVI